MSLIVVIITVTLFPLYSQNGSLLDRSFGKKIIPQPEKLREYICIVANFQKNNNKLQMVSGGSGFIHIDDEGNNFIISVCL
jgi:hypothetical protein